MMKASHKNNLIFSRKLFHSMSNTCHISIVSLIAFFILSISPEIYFTFAQSREQFWPANMLMGFESKANMNGNEKYKWKYIEVTYSLKLLQVIILHDFSKKYCRFHSYFLERQMMLTALPRRPAPPKISVRTPRIQNLKIMI